MDQLRAPLFETLRRLTTDQRASFHVPGHKFGKGLTVEERPFFEQLMSIDYTEITGLDDLHQPHGIIQEAQQLAAQCFGADHTFFLVNGSTAGNLALILSCCGQNDLIIVQRDVHKSVLHALMLAGARAVFISPMIDEQSGLPTGINIDELSAVLQQFPEAKAVFITNPNYYGLGIKLEAMVKLVHSYQIPLLVDEAHGAHYGFHPQLPESALASGADGVVQSTHKTLSALTMGAMLHIQGKRINADTVQQRLAIVQSSSPSYPILASLDISRRKMAAAGKEIIAQGLSAVNQFKQSLRQWSWYAAVAVDDQPGNTQDPFKIALKDATGTLSGFALQQEIERHGCMTEMADPQYVLLMFSMYSTDEDVQRLCRALDHISHEFQLNKQELSKDISNTTILRPVVHNKRPVAFELPSLNKNTPVVQLEDAIAMRSADMVIPYPPGIPLLYPGEVITAEIAHYIRQLIQLGAQFHGSTHVYEQRLRVMSDAVSEEA